MRRLACALALICAAGASGCERALHQMYDQAKYKPLTPTTLFPDGNSSRPQVKGTVVRSSGALAGSSSGRIGSVMPEPDPGPVLPLDASGRELAQPGVEEARTYPNPLPITQALLERGRERFDIYCAPCHSRVGDGDGMIARRGFPAPPSYHTERLRAAPDSHFYQVITQGYGVMFPYADRIAPNDRWAVIAYIRALQLSQHASAELLSGEDRARLAGGKP